MPTAHYDRAQRVQRRDRVTFQAVDLPPKRAAPGGAWDCAGVFARDGVQVYDGEDGRPVREARPRSEVMKSAPAMRGLVVTLQHPGDGQDPDQGAGEVTPENARDLWHGHVMDADGDWPTPGLLGGWARTCSAALHGAMTSGTVECSVGYTAVLRDPRDPEVAHLVAELGPEPGLTHDGESYDLIQTEITPNHLAIVDQARAGAVARLRLDGQRTMATKIQIAGKTHEIAPFMVRAIKADSLDTVAQAKAKADALEVGEIVIEGQTLVLPKSTVDQILAMLGGGSGPSVPEPMPAGDEGGEEMPPPPPPPMPAADGGDMPPPPMRTDGLTQAQIDAMVARSLQRLAPATTRKITDSVLATSRERANLERDASLVLGQRHDFAGQDDHEVAVQVLKADSSPRLARAEQLAAAARKGDAMAAGRLRQMMDDCLDARRDAQDSSRDLAGWMFDASASAARTDAADDETPERDRARAAKRDKAQQGAAA